MDILNQSIESKDIKKQIQKLLTKLNKRQTYQFLLVALISFALVISTIISVTGFFVFMNPVFQCKGNISSEQQACIRLSQCKITEQFTGTFSAQLYCQKKYIRSTIQSAIFFGSFLGMFTVVPLSDWKGRKYLVLLGLLLSIIGTVLNFIGIQTKFAVLMIIGQFLNGMFMASTTIGFYVIISQFTDDKMRPRFLMICCSMQGIGEMLLLPIYQFIPQWQYFIMLISLIPMLILLVIFKVFLLQTPFFCLFHQKNLKNFSQCIDIISKYNKSDQQDLQAIKSLAIKYIQRESELDMDQKRVKKSALNQLLINQNFIPCICIALSQSAFNLYYFSLQGTMERTGYNFGVSFFIVGIHQFFGYLLFSCIGDKIPRKNGLSMTIFLSSMIGLTFLTQVVIKSQIIQTILVSLARLLTIFTYSFIVYLQTQSFSENVKSTAMGVSDGLSQITKLLAPYFIVLMNDKKIHPIIISSIVYLFLGIIPVFFLKQTLRVDQQQKSNEIIDQESDNAKGSERSFT